MQLSTKMQFIKVFRLLQERNGNKMANIKNNDPFKEMMSFDVSAPSKAQQKAAKQKHIEKKKAKKAAAAIERAQELENDILEQETEQIISTKKSLTIIGSISAISVVVFVALFVILKAFSLVGTEVMVKDFVERFNSVGVNDNSAPAGYGDIPIGSDGIERSATSTIRLYDGIVLNISTRNNEILWAEIICSDSHLVFDADNPSEEGRLSFKTADFGYNYYGMCARLVRGIDPSLNFEASSVGLTADEYAYGIVNTLFTFTQNNALKNESYNQNGVFSYTDSMTSAHISYTITYYKDGGISFLVTPNTAEEDYSIS